MAWAWWRLVSIAVGVVGLLHGRRMVSERRRFHRKRSNQDDSEQTWIRTSEAQARRARGERKVYRRARLGRIQALLNQSLALLFGDERLQLGRSERVHVAGLGCDQQQNLSSSERAQFVRLRTAVAARRVTVVSDRRSMIGGS